MEPEDLTLVIVADQHPVGARYVGTVLFPEATVCVPAGQREDYDWAGPRRLERPDALGLGGIWRWLFKTVTTRGLVLLADDLAMSWAMVGQRQRPIDDPAALWRICYQAAQVADDLGVRCFGFSPGVRSTSSEDPFELTILGGPVIGFIQTGQAPLLMDFDDPHAVCDLSLTCLQKDRIVWVDTRYRFETTVPVVETLTPPTALRRKWGATVKVRENRGMWTANPAVRRRVVVD